MIDALYIGATGMQAQQLNVDSIANNLANINTSGYKRSRVSFDDLLYRDVARTAATAQSSDASGRAGVGVSLANISKIFTQGDLKKTDVPLDVAIQGQGFFEITLPDGSLAYTRSGHFQINRDGYLVTADGHPLKDQIQVPNDAREIVIQATGAVLANLPDEKDLVEIGQIELTNFVNPSGLSPQGSNLYVSTELSGESINGKPGESGFGTLAQGSLESSNVKLIEETLGLIVAQRAYEVNAKVIQAADEMLGMSNNLRR